MTHGVSRETPPLPPEATRVFGPAVDRVARFAAILASDGVGRGLIGPREVERLWPRHLLNCGVMAPHLPRVATVADVGSGAGLPGMVWAIARPDLQVTLIEPLLRRATFLTEATACLRLDNVTVVRSRAEDLHGRAVFGVVTARAVAPLERLLRWCLPLVEPGGQLMALKGHSAPAELEAARPLLATMGATSAAVRTYGEGIVDPVTRVVHVHVGSETGGQR